MKSTGKRAASKKPVKRAKSSKKALPRTSVEKSVFHTSAQLNLKRFEPSKTQRLEMYHLMLLNRAFDDRISKLYRQGKIIGAAYGGRGQEATTVGSTYALNKTDIVGPIIRNGGSLLVRGLSPKNFLANFVGRASTPTRGKDGNSHLGDLSLGIFAPISHLGSLVINLAGCALAFKMKKEPRVALTYIGDGGTSTGEFHEGMNMAAVWKLPFVCIIENNNYAYSTPTGNQALIKNFAVKGKAYGMEAIVMDGNDVFEVYSVCKYAVEKARAGGGPVLIESKTMRMKGHAEHDDASYVPKTLFAEWQRKDPIGRCEKFLLDEKFMTAAENKKLKEKVAAEMEEAEAFALSAPFPEGEEAVSGVYAD